MRTQLLLGLALLTVTLAGCSGGSGTDDVDVDVDEVDATSSTGGIRGIVVDTAITPIAGATVTILNTEMTAVTGEDGTFVISGLPAGEHFVEATHPLYDTVQQMADVVAGVKDPAPIKLQLTRLIAAEPYLTTEKYDGFISCSANIIVFLSEECGEGVGVPGMGRVGGQENNMAQIDFTVDGPTIQSLVVEQVWEPSFSAGNVGSQSGGFYTVVATEWSCDPVCGGNRMGEADSGSPLYIHIPAETLEQAELTSETVISSFTWASAEETGVLLDQEFQLFITKSYHLPLPEVWSFVNEDPVPF